MDAAEKCSTAINSGDVVPSRAQVRRVLRRSERVLSDLDRLKDELLQLDDQINSWVDAGIDPGRRIGERPWYAES